MKGSGLSLLIRSRIITHHNGHLSVQAGKELKGARFVIELLALEVTS